MTLEELQALFAAGLLKLEALEAKETLTDDENKEFETLLNEQKALDNKIELMKHKAMLANRVDEKMTTDTPNAQNNGVGTASAEYKENFDKFLGQKYLDEAVAVDMRVGVYADGGYIVPEVYRDTVTQKLNILGRTRMISNVMRTTSTTNIPVEGDAPTFTWIDEGDAYGETKSTFGQVKLNAYKLGGIIKVSEELMKDNSINFDAYMANQIAKGIDKAESPAFAVGTGTGQPTGYSTNAPTGANSTTAAVDAVTADELIDIFYDLKEEYRGRATWRMTDLTEKAIRKLKDGDGNYLWSPALNEASRNTLLGRPIVIDNSMPELGTGNKFILIGDFNYYEIADRGSMTIQKLVELYAATGFIGFKVTARVDAKPTLEEAFNAGKNA